MRPAHRAHRWRVAVRDDRGRVVIWDCAYRNCDASLTRAQVETGLASAIKRYRRLLADDVKGEAIAWTP